MSTTLLDSTTDTNTGKLSEAGVSIWLDDINRENLQNGKLQQLIDIADVVGVTTNPTIFATALSKGNAYDEQLKELSKINSPIEEAVFEITTQDVGNAADLFRGIYDATGGQDGRVSIEVSPGNAYDGAATFAEARKLWEKVGRENVMIKIPATKEGLDAIRNTIAEGISVNVTLIFGLDRYREVIDAYLSGLEAADAKGLDLSKIHSVASFFVSRVDTEVNKRLDKSDLASAAGLHNKVAVANARLAYQLFTETFAGERATALTGKGANVQRPLWASTGVKTDDLPDTFYVTSLVAANVVNTMPEKTLDAIIDHGEITLDTATEYDDATKVMRQLAEVGIDINEVTEALEAEGVQKFVDSWSELGKTVERQLQD